MVKLQWHSLKLLKEQQISVFDRNTPALERAFADGSDTSVKLAIEREFGEDAMAYLLYSTAVKLVVMHLMLQVRLFHMMNPQLITLS